MPLKLDHIGLVVEDIKKARDIFEAIGLEGGTKAVPDPIQKVTASFITVGKEDGVYIELLEPTSDDSPISNFLEKKVVAITSVSRWRIFNRPSTN